MLEDLGKALVNVGLAGVGLAALAAEQAGKAGKLLVEKGAAAVEEGRKYGAEMQEKYRQEAARRREEQFDLQLTQMDAGQREALRLRLSQLDELEQEAVQADQPDKQEDQQL